MTAIEPFARPLHRHSTARAYESAVTAVIARMRERPGEPLNLAEMAQMAGVSRCHFDRVFRGVTGLSPRQFQTAVRLRKATQLLLTTARNVTDICFDVGYESLGSFVTKFTQTFGLPPHKLRELGAHLNEPWSEWLTDDLITHFAPAGSEASVGGTVAVPEMMFDGLIFVGVFDKPMPTSAPSACCVISNPGRFAIASNARGTRHVLAIGIPWCERPLEFLVNDLTLRGAAADAITTQPEQRVEVHIDLRPPHALDPPINLALPILLVQKVVESGLRRSRSE